MAQYWHGPSLYQYRTRRVTNKNPFLAERAPNQYRYRERSLLRRRWQAGWQRITPKLHDIVSLTRYVAHFVLLVIAFIVTMIHGLTVSTALSFIPAYMPERDSVRPLVWADNKPNNSDMLSWQALPLTVIFEQPAQMRVEAISYQVREGDNPELIAKRFGLKPTTVIWANSTVEEHPELLTLGQTLIIPPVDGVFHTVRAGDTLATIAGKYAVSGRVIVEYEANKLTDENIILTVGQNIVVPGGVKQEKPPEPLAMEPVPATPIPPTPIPPTPIPTAIPTQVPTRVIEPTQVPARVIEPTQVVVAVIEPTQVVVAVIEPTQVPTRVIEPTQVPTRVIEPTQVPTRRPAPTNTPVPVNSNNSVGVSTGCCRWPLQGRITTQPSSWHMALDILSYLGTPIVAADGGRVVAAGWDNTGYGYRLIVNHGNGITTLYAHLSSFSVSYGDYVNKGAMIGRVGSTGRSTAPHLHFEVRRNNIRVNPYNWLP